MFQKVQKTVGPDRIVGVTNHPDSTDQTQDLDRVADVHLGIQRQVPII